MTVCDKHESHCSEFFSGSVEMYQHFILQTSFAKFPPKTHPHHFLKSQNSFPNSTHDSSHLKKTTSTHIFAKFLQVRGKSSSHKNKKASPDLPHRARRTISPAAKAESQNLEESRQDLGNGEILSEAQGSSFPLVKARFPTDLARGSFQAALAIHRETPKEAFKDSSLFIIFRSLRRKRNRKKSIVSLSSHALGKKSTSGRERKIKGE